MSQFFSPLFAATPPEIERIAIPELDELLDDEPVPDYAYEETMESARDQLAAIFHSSGSSGNPKPVFYTMNSVASWSSGHLLRRAEGEFTLWDTYFPAQNVLSLLPLFHVCLLLFCPSKQDVLSIRNPTNIMI